MKFTEHKPKKRDVRARAGEVLNIPEESVEKFDVDVHLTDQDWERAGESLIITQRHSGITSSGLTLQASLLRLNPVRFRQLMSQLPAEVKGWYLSLGDNGDDRIENAISNKIRDVHIRTDHRIDAREVYLDHQPPFVLSSVDRAELIECIRSSNYDEQALNALVLSSLLLRFPGEDSNLGKDPSLILDEAGWKIIIDWANKKLDTKFTETFDLNNLIWFLVKIRTVSPERFNQLTLGKPFWDQALKYLKEKLTELNHPISSCMSLANQLHILSAAEVHLNSTGVLVVETETQRNLKSARPLPDRDVS